MHPEVVVDAHAHLRQAVLTEVDVLDRADLQAPGLHVGALDEPVDLVERRGQGVAAPAAQRDEGHDDHSQREGGEGEDPLRASLHRQPIGIRGFAPQKIRVPTMLMSVTPMMLTAIERAVAVPTSIGPPRTL